MSGSGIALLWAGDLQNFLPARVWHVLGWSVRRGRRMAPGGEAGTVGNQVAELRNPDASTRITFENASQNGI